MKEPVCTDADEEIPFNNLALQEISYRYKRIVTDANVDLTEMQMKISFADLVVQKTVTDASGRGAQCR